MTLCEYETLEDRKKKCRPPVGWFDVDETKLIGPDVISQAVDKVKLIREQLLVTTTSEPAQWTKGVSTVYILDQQLVKECPEIVPKR